MPARAAAFLTNPAPKPPRRMRRMLPLLCLLSGSGSIAKAGTSASYNLTPSIATNAGGGSGTSASYTFDTTADSGLQGTSTAFTSRTGFAGQLDEIVSISPSIVPSPLPETTIGQLQATLLSSAGFLTDFTQAGISWSIVSGPLSTITPAGAVTAGKVYQLTSATIQASAQGFTTPFTFPVSDTDPDNFGNYAGDRLPDWWQVQHFGLGHLGAAQGADPDGDNQNNLLEFAFGTHPANNSSGSATITYSGGLVTAHGLPLPVITNIPGSVDYRVVFARRIGFTGYGLRYDVQFSPDLLTWITSAATPAVLATDGEFEAASVPWPLFSNGRKIRFFRVAVELLPAPSP